MNNISEQQIKISKKVVYLYYGYYIETKKNLPAGTEISLFQSTAEHSLIAADVLSFSAFHSPCFLPSTNILTQRPMSSELCLASL